MRLLSLVLISGVLMTSCNDPVEKKIAVSDLNISENTVFTTEPEGPSFAAETEGDCRIDFAIALDIPESFFISAEKTYTQHQVLDTCLSENENTVELGRVYFSRNEPISGGPNPHNPPSSQVTEEHGGPPSQNHVALSDFLHTAYSFSTSGEAQSFLACMSSGLSDYFQRALSAHGHSETGFLVHEGEAYLHVHYDLTVFGMTSYVSQLVKIFESSEKSYVVFTTSTDANESDAETYCHTGVKVTCE
jgi:hypothetical protein